MAFENGKETGMPRNPCSTTQNTPKQDEPEVSQPKREISQTSPLGEKLPKTRTSDQGQDFAIQAMTLPQIPKSDCMVPTQSILIQTIALPAAVVPLRGPSKNQLPQ